MNSKKIHFFNFKYAYLVVLFLMNIHIVKGVTIRDHAAILCLSSSNISVLEEKAQEVTTVRSWDITIITYDSAILSCQGIPCTREGVSAKENDEFFLVKNWNFLEEGTSSEEGYEYKNGVNTETVELNGTEFDSETGQLVTLSDYNIYGDIRREGHIYEWVGTPEVTDAIGLSAQGEVQNPYADFGVHYITMANGKIYDPSYGNIFSNVKEWEENSVEAFFKLWEDSEGKWFYKIRKNTTDDEIVLY